MEQAYEVFCLGSRKGVEASRAATRNEPLSGNVRCVMVGRDDGTRRLGSRRGHTGGSMAEELNVPKGNQGSGTGRKQRTVTSAPAGHRQVSAAVIPG